MKPFIVGEYCFALSGLWAELMPPPLDTEDGCCEELAVTKSFRNIEATDWPAVGRSPTSEESSAAAGDDKAEGAEEAGLRPEVSEASEYRIGCSFDCQLAAAGLELPDVDVGVGLTTSELPKVAGSEAFSLTSAVLIRLVDRELSRDWASVGSRSEFVDRLEDDELEADDDGEELAGGGGKADRAIVLEAADETIRMAMDSSEGPTRRAKSSARAAAAVVGGDVLLVLASLCRVR